MATVIPRLLDRDWLESAYGIPWKTALNWEKDWLLRVVRFGRKCYFDRDEIEELIDQGGRRFRGGWRREPAAS